MERANQIKTHPLFLWHMTQNRESERDRQFCKHNLTHALDVARIAHIINLEEGIGLPKEQIYAAALLHDLTKWQQHTEGIPHNESVIEPALEILLDCDFPDTEIAAILNAIFQHRSPPEDSTPFSRLLFRADKLSRACYACTASADCNWDRDKQNHSISH